MLDEIAILHRPWIKTLQIHEAPKQTTSNPSYSSSKEIWWVTNQESLYAVTIFSARLTLLCYVFRIPYFECVSAFLIHLIYSSPVSFWCLWGNALNLACHARDNALCAVAAWKDCLTCWRRMARIRGGAQYCMKMEAGPTTTKFQARHYLFTRLYCVCTESQIESGNWKTMRIHCLQKEPLYQNLRISRIMTWFRSTGWCFAISWSKIWFHLNDQKPSPSSHLSVHLDVQVTNALVVPLVLPEDRLATVQLGQWRWGQWKKPVWNLANRMGATT